ncbi:hypothetical protein SAY86_022389 [Trapa natans]|uniref:Uncharacterized protein n=1 Tax=Trapa natans TaxID=22666 RepID=A0AAN7LVM0_TRANT|nr:hypothetical protein SAY86_022389 [Trapa natans]
MSNTSNTNAVGYELQSGTSLSCFTTDLISVLSPLTQTQCLCLLFAGWIPHKLIVLLTPNRYSSNLQALLRVQNQLNQSLIKERKCLPPSYMHIFVIHYPLM